MSSMLSGLPNAQLLARVCALVRRGNAVDADLLVHLGEIDARQLYLQEGCSSMFTYCCRAWCSRMRPERWRNVDYAKDPAAPPEAVARGAPL